MKVAIISINFSKFHYFRKYFDPPILPIGKPGYAFDSHSNSHNHITRNNNILVLANSNKSKSQSKFLHQSIKQWNILPDHIKTSDTLLNPFVPTVPTCAVRETASLGIMGAPRVPPLNPSESVVF